MEEGFDERKDKENKYIKKKEKCHAFPFFCVDTGNGEYIKRNKSIMK